MKVWFGVVVLAACSSPEPKAPSAEHALQMCSGQTAESTASASTPREGAMTLQLAPSLLDRMPACSTHDAMPPPNLVQTNAGMVNANGDCEWSNGVKCHFHRGAEFVDSREPRPDVDELHCVFPSGAPKSPFVYGGHFTCKAGGTVQPHELEQGHACGANLLGVVASMMEHCNARCCDSGTLTDTAEERQHARTLDIRPDFRICSATAELDCNMFAGMRAREANAPMFGAPVAGK